MPQSLIRNYIHIVFSTKNRAPFITSKVEYDLHSYLSQICKDQKCASIKIGGYIDHVHVLCLLSSTVTLSELLKHMKASSSKWMKTQGEEFQDFAWQRGYGAFSVNPSEIEIVKKYIANQHEHHKKKTFKEEYLQFLKKYDVDYDEKYLWD